MCSAIAFSRLFTLPLYNNCYSILFNYLIVSTNLNISAQSQYVHHVYYGCKQLITFPTSGATNHFTTAIFDVKIPHIFISFGKLLFFSRNISVLIV